MAIEIRRAGRADLPAIIAMLADDPLGSTREDIAQPPAPAYVAAFEVIAADPSQFLAVMTEDDAVIGTLQLTFVRGLSRQGALRGQIEAVRIAGTRRGGGLGQHFIEWAVEECRQRGCVMVQLTSDKSRAGAHRFYERLGFKASHLGFKMELD